jgi:hypothetical protein
MIQRDNNDVEVAVQYLVWALEEIEKIDRRKAAGHVRRALDELRRASPRRGD